jgi:hypothetical protein
MKNLFFMLVMFTFAAQSKEVSARKGLIDLGSGEVESDIEGSQYLLRIRGSFQDRIKDLDAALDQQSFKEIEARNLKVALGKRKKSYE